MLCPFCKAMNTRVSDSRLQLSNNQIKRRRECIVCHKRFSTFEQIDLSLPKVVKKDGSREPFTEDKLRDGIQKAFEKRPTSVETFDQLIANVIDAILNEGKREIQSVEIGDIVMQYIRDIDQVAYVRFASVYRSFKDTHEFYDWLSKMGKRVVSDGKDPA